MYVVSSLLLESELLFPWTIADPRPLIWLAIRLTLLRSGRGRLFLFLISPTSTTPFHTPRCTTTVTLPATPTSTASLRKTPRRRRPVVRRRRRRHRRRRTTGRIRIAHITRRAAREDPVGVADDDFSTAPRRGTTSSRGASGDGAAGAAGGGGCVGGGVRAGGGGGGADGAGLDVAVEALDDVAGGGGLFEVGALVAVDGLF
jgi:uncharacterized membrane protein YgcG